MSRHHTMMLTVWLALGAMQVAGPPTMARGADGPSAAEAPTLEPPPGDPWSSPQPQGRRGPRRASGLVFKDRITPHWFDDNACFWYRNDLADGARSSSLVDARKGTRAPAFDHKRLAEALAKAVGKEVDGGQAPVRPASRSTITAKTVRFKLGETVWKCDLATLRVHRRLRTPRPRPMPRRVPHPAADSVAVGPAAVGEMAARPTASGPPSSRITTSTSGPRETAEPVRLSSDGKEGSPTAGSPGRPTRRRWSPSASSRATTRRST